MKNKKNMKQGNELEVEFMPIAPTGDVIIDEKEKATFPEILPIVALKNTVLFPSVVLPINASRSKSVEAIKAGDTQSKFVGILTQIDGQEDEPNVNGLYTIGTIAKIVKQINMPDGNKAVFIMGRARFRVVEFLGEDPYFQARVEYLTDEDADEKKDNQYKALLSSVKEISDKIVNLSHNLPPEIILMLKNIDNNKFLINYIASNIEVDLSEKQELLEEGKLKVRAEKLVEILKKELQIAELKNEIQLKTKGEMDKQQREYYLQQQLKSIKDELDGGAENPELRELKEKASHMDWPEHAQEAFDKGIVRLEKIHPQAPEYSIQLNYLNTLVDLPWNIVTLDVLDLKKANRILDSEHYGLDKVKDRILEYLAVLKLKGDLKSPILCFVGPPGIGKTSLGQSIAKAIDRSFVRMSLGGLHDESELRGHRKTYIGAMPGRIIQSIKKAKTSNPVFILDEIEKMGKDFRGDPSSALLEILDPEQNHSFYDNYLEIEYDLSKVMFIATANSLSEIQPALRDRMEIIQLSGYSLEEKKEIAKKHLIPKQKEAHALTDFKITFAKDALEYLIQFYTRESGLRELNRVLASIMRSIAKDLAMGEEPTLKIDKNKIENILGHPKYSYDIYQKGNPPGVAVGLAWTQMGGDILFIESILSNGNGLLNLTGNLGDVMKESAMTALSYLKAHASDYEIDSTVFENSNIHIHVPEGAIPKDGPSAGVTMLSAITSLLTGRPLKPFLAMTGEITLRGQVLPVGGIKEKILAAKRAGLKEILLCSQNEKDVEVINKDFIKGLKFHYVDTMDEVLSIALMKTKRKSK